VKSLQSLSYKTLFIIFFLSLAGIVFFLKIGGKTQKVSAAWWDESWHYRKSISVTNSSGSNLTDFQVSISIGTSQLIADGKMQTDCDDIRITDINGNLLPYWIEENNPGCNSASGDTKIWLKANSLPTSGATIYAYYGNSSASNNENGDNVFEFFDDFKNGTSKWTFETGVTASIITESNNKIMALSNATTWKGAFAGNESMNNYYFESRLKTSNTRGGLYIRHKASGNTDNGYYLRTEGDNFGYSQNDSALGAYGTYTLDTNTWYNMKILAVGTSVSLFINDINQNINQVVQNSTGSIGVSPIEPASISSYDYIFVHKYASTQPTTSNQSEEIGTAPIAYWKFDEGVGTTAYDSTGSNNGTFGTGSSAPTWANESQCISGKCLSFDGTQSVNSNYDASWNNTNKISINFWVKPQNITDIQTGIIGKQYSLYEWSFYQNGNSVSLVYWNTSGGHTNEMDDSWGSVLTANKWTNLAYTWDGSTSKFYADGKLVKTKTATNPSINMNRTNNMMFGGNIYTWGDKYFKGSIDEVKIYPYARTADQIKLDYNSRGSSSGSSANLGVQSNTAPSLKSGLVAYYKFDENSGTSVYDSSGNNHTGSFIGTTKPTWQTGKYKSGIGFSGVNDSISLPYQPNFRNAFSVSVWFKRTTDYNQTTDVMLLSPPYAWFFYDSYNTGAIRGDVYIDGTRRAGINVPIPFDGNWYHVVYTYDSTTHTAKMYKNGKLYQYNDLTSLGLSNYLVDPATGNLSNMGSNSKGRGVIIDEAKIYNRAITDQEVFQDYNQGSAISFGQTTQNIGGTTTSLDYCIPGDASTCSAPVAEWKMDEGIGTSIIDTSGNNNTGTLGTGNSAPTWTQGKIGKAMNFDGNDYTSATLNGTNLTDYSVNFWFKTDTVSGATGILQWANSLSSSTPMFYVHRNNASIDIYNSGAYSSTIPINSNTWYYFSAVYSAGSTTTTIYINGIPKTTFVRQQTFYNYATNLYAGNGYNGFFDGQIDHVKIYNYARTPAQIAYDYNKGGPVGWWKFDECQGNIAYDWSGIGNTGTIIIGASGTQNSLGTCQVGTSAAWTNGVSGKTNSSLNLDGTDDYVWIGNNSLFCPSNITVSSWFKAPSNSTGTIIRNRGSGFGLSLASGTVNTYVYQATGSNLGTSTSTTYGNNLWHNAIMTYDGTAIKIYIDGILKNSQIGTGTGTIYCSGNALGIGRDADYSGSYFNGQIDDVRIYNYALTSEQVKQIYNGGAVNFQ